MKWTFTLTIVYGRYAGQSELSLHLRLWLLWVMSHRADSLAALRVANVDALY